MSKKDKKIEIQITDSKVKVGSDEFDGQFAIIKNGNVDAFYKKLEKAVENLIETYNLSK